MNQSINQSIVLQGASFFFGTDILFYDEGEALTSFESTTTIFIIPSHSISSSSFFDELSVGATLRVALDITNVHT